MDGKLRVTLPSIGEDSVMDEDGSLSGSPTSSELSFSSLTSSSSSEFSRESRSKLVCSPPASAPVRSLNTNMFAFTRSISALNTVTSSIGVLRAKNAFMKKLSQDALPSPEEYRHAGLRHWNKIAAKSKVITVLADMDFSDLEATDVPDANSNIRAPPGTGTGGPPPPPPIPPPMIMSMNPRHATSSAIPPPPPPPLTKLLTPPHPQCGPPPPPPPPCGGPPPPPPPAPPGCPPPHLTSLQASVRKSVKMVKIHWRSVPDSCLRNDTIWKKSSSVNWDRDKIEKLFKIEEKARRSSLENSGKAKELHVLDSKRSNQINIGIKNLPNLNNLKTVIEEMSDKDITREGIEKLQSLIPTDEEISSIKDAQRNNSELPLGSAEQFLLILSSINGLDCKLKLWAFKVDFKAMEKDICEPLLSLKEGMRAVQKSDIFCQYLNLLLEIGNFLNSSNASGFQLDFLSKVTWVKDTVHKKPLLHHVVKEMTQSHPESGDFSKDFAALQIVSRTDFDLLENNLLDMEEECKSSLGYINLGRNYSSETKELVSTFLDNATQRILSMKIIFKRITNLYEHFLTWFGLSKHLHKDYPPQRTAILLLNFSKELSDTRKVILDEALKERRREEKIKHMTRVKASPRRGTPVRNPVSVKSVGSDEGCEADGLEEFLDAVAATNVSNGKRRRSKKMTLQQMEGFNIATL